VTAGRCRLSLAIGGGNDVILPLTNGDGRQVSGTQIRILLSGTHTAYTGARAALLVPRVGGIDPSAWASQFSNGVLQSNAATVNPELPDAGLVNDVLYSGGACSVLLPDDATKAFTVGTWLYFWCGTAQVVTISAGGSATVTPPPGRSGVMTGLGSFVGAYKRAANTWAITGDLV